MKKEISKEASEAGRALTSLRWDKASPEEKKSHVAMMNKARIKKLKENKK